MLRKQSLLDTRNRWALLSPQWLQVELSETQFKECERHPERIIEEAVKGGRFQRTNSKQSLNRLRISAGSDHAWPQHKQTRES